MTGRRHAALRCISTLLIDFPKAIKIFKGSPWESAVGPINGYHSSPNVSEEEIEIQKFVNTIYQILYSALEEDCNESGNGVDAEASSQSGYDEKNRNQDEEKNESKAEKVEEERGPKNRLNDNDLETEFDVSGPHYKPLSAIFRESFTPYNIIFVSLLIGLGSWKAYAVEHSTPIVGNVLDWVIGLVISVMLAHYFIPMTENSSYIFLYSMLWIK